MEMTVRYAKNADADVDASYLRNLPLIKLLQQEPVNTEDWDVLLSATPNGEDKLLWCLSYVGALCALDATDFDNWFIRPTTISDYYNEIAERMNLNHLDLICEALDCSPTEILVREPNPEPRVRNRTGFEKPVTGQRKDGE